MINKDDPREAYREVFEEAVFEQLISTTRAEDPALDYYKIKLVNQKASEDDFTRYSKLYSEIVMDKYEKFKDDSDDPPTAEDKRQFIVEALDEAWEKYNEKHDNST
jgi:hypothetical protein